MTYSLNDRVALITGASRGIGAQLARDLVQRGAIVVLVARSESPLDALVEELGREKAHRIAMDITDRDALRSLPQKVLETRGRLDILVNNAGAHHRGPFNDLSPEQITTMVEANLTAPMLLTHAALPRMSADGVVVNIASLAGKVPVPGSAVYSGTKFGLRAFARALDLELSGTGSRIRVITVNPGPVDTAFFGEDLSKAANLTFSQPMSTVDDVSRAVVRALEEGHQEADVPPLSGKLATLGYLSPKLYRTLRPALEALGARNKERHARRGGRNTR